MEMVTIKIEFLLRLFIEKQIWSLLLEVEELVLADLVIMMVVKVVVSLRLAVTDKGQMIAVEVG